MKYGIQEANAYMFKIREALRANYVLLYGESPVYLGRKGHLKLARECGYALKDFDEDGQAQILKGSYSIIYVSGTNLKPVLNAKEWIAEMRKQLSGDSNV